MEFLSVGLVQVDTPLSGWLIKRMVLYQENIYNMLIYQKKNLLSLN